MGTVISGTLRRQDLIPAFIDELARVDPIAYSQLLLAPFGPIPSYVYDEGDSSDWWASEDAGYLLESLFDALDESAPEDEYFGAHPGDGSDFGFWPVEEKE